MNNEYAFKNYVMYQYLYELVPVASLPFKKELYLQ